MSSFEIINLACDAIGSGIISFTFFLLGKKAGIKAKKTITRDEFGEVHRPDESGVFPWLFSIKHYKYLCPHCRCKNEYKKIEKICECESYHSEHFHFICGVCGFKAIMKTALNSI